MNIADFAAGERFSVKDSLPNGSCIIVNDANNGIIPVRIITTWLVTCASLGTSLRVWKCIFDILIAFSPLYFDLLISVIIVLIALSQGHAV